MLRPIRVLLAALVLFAGAAHVSALAAEPPAIRAVQTEGDRLDQAAEFARRLSRLEASRDWSALAALMHPDSRAVVPDSAVVGWYEATFAGKTTAELSVTAAEPIEWTWPVNGAVYDVVRVSYVQPYWVDGVRSDETGVVHVAQTPDGGWGWFFGASRAFVDEQIALYASPTAAPAVAVGGLIDPAEVTEADRAARFPDPLHAHIDAFWADRFAAAAVPYQPPAGVVAIDRPTPTGCGIADPATETAFYCVLDATIYYSADFRRVVEDNIGDFGWVVVVAHEWGHHVQLLLGDDAGMRFWADGGSPSASMEQQADCLAGAYTDSAEFSGWLDPGDVDEALLVTGLSGDPAGTSPVDPEAHGSGPQRVDAFNAGYGDGLVACGLGDGFAGG